MIQRVLPFASRVPTAEVANGVVLNVDGSIAIGFEVQPLEHTASSTSTVATTCNTMSDLVRWLPDGTIVQLFVSLIDEKPSVVTGFADRRRRGGSSASDKLSDSIARHAMTQRFRDVRCWIFICRPYHFQNAALVRAGALPLTRPHWDEASYAKALSQLEEISLAAASQLAAAGLRVERASDQSLTALIQRHLNPGRRLPTVSAAQADEPSPDYANARQFDPRRTLREMLCATHAELPDSRHLRLGDRVLRTLSMRSLPDSTHAGMLSSLFFDLAAPATFSISAEKLPSHAALASLKMRRSMAHALSTLSARRNIDAEVQHNELETLMEGLSRSSMCLCAMQVLCAIDDDDAARLNERLSKAEQAFSRAGVATLVEDFNHLDAYLAMLPGAAHRFRRSLTVHDANVAHGLVPFGVWRGASRAALLLRSRSGDAVSFDPFATELPAFNGLVVGASGSGKSFFTNLLLANHISSGGGAVVVDIGGSYRRLTELFDGSYVDIGAEHSIGLNPLLSGQDVAALSPEDRDAKLQYLAGFLELLATESGAMPTSERAVLAKALATYYAKKVAPHDRTPTLAEFQLFLQSFGEADDHLLALKLVRRLDLWTAGPRARLFERGVDLSLNPSIVAIDLKAIESDKELQAVALYVLSFVIWSKLGASSNRQQTMVVFDECWALLSNPPAARLIENLVRTTRKYGAGLWCLSQSADDFVGSSIGPALLANSFTRVLLRHAFDHARVAKIFGLTDFGETAFRTLTSQKGEYAEAFLQVGNKAELVQISPSPLAYWMATTSAVDRDAENLVRRANPRAPLINITSALAERFPKGV